ncbi:cation:dicarboxylase symporter family transporter [Campylobacter fetus]|uniref:Aerobic C4-dicarboxylate transport protein n=2 Tax=Campylobacter fetus TaxID=196 RepID=A0RN45_CAMFF|nr:cation:dicarboxylase symporter family transporter [Campylobacter fetus]ABK82238.1 aerobic C4-dicarboxylate transport protein [Campylobacter fetus subsp. fetus 82-40]EAI3886476.1 cation:dicarboxylase symporter family transporter [Campylobacter fetus]EAI3915556.1 cation:dicarboxylase symporter family transporter [Campylobacter fetus]EAI3919191.1 cation:dicarboxylase symporter family transporter [Campylobacter fetus]EAI8858473.1 cation:dicarboxylase symporter family transporter [Campylobacter 
MNSTVSKNKQSIFVRTVTNLAFWVVIGIVLGIATGVISPELGEASKPGIDWFIKILKLMIGPIIFLTIVSGVIGLDSLKEVGSIGFKGFVYFEVVSTLALAVGIGSALFFQPGVGMNLDINALDPSSVAKYVKDPKEVGSALAILKSAIPPDPITPFIKANTLQVLFMALMTAIILSILPNHYKKNCMKPLEFAQHYVLKILAWFMWLSPIAAYSAMAYLIGKFGLSSLFGMIQLLAVMATACLIFIFVILGAICYMAKVNIFKFMRFIAKEVLIVFATSSSEIALGPLMKKLEAAGISRGCVGLIVPTGYSFNLDCTNIYLSMSVIFLAQAFNIDLSFTHLLSILIILMITSKGAVGVTGSGFIVLAGTFGALHDVIPVVTVAVLLGVDKFMSEMRAVGNLCGNSVACLIVAIWDKKIDMEKFRYALDHPDEFSFN